MMNDQVKMAKLTYVPPKKTRKHSAPEAPKRTVEKKNREKKKKVKERPAFRDRTAAVTERVSTDFLDRIAPAAVKFNTDHYILGSSYRSVFAIRGYPTSTDELALLRHLGDKSGVTLSVYVREVTPAEENRILHDAGNKNRMNRASSGDLKASVTAEANLQDMAALITTIHSSREPLTHCAVFVELTAKDQESLRTLQNEVMAELIRAKISTDRLLLRQQEGFRAVNPAGCNSFGTQFERVLPASSVANLYPFCYSGKLDPHGFYIGRDRFGSNIIVDLDRRAADKTNANVLILGNSGEGKSYLLKLLTIHLLEAGKTVICLDPEHETSELCDALGGCFLDLMSGRYVINPLEPKLWNVEGETTGVPVETQRSGFDGEGGDEEPEPFRLRSRLSQHISFLKDFFRAYKDFSQKQIDTIELMLERLYRKWQITDDTDFSALHPEDYPTLADLYAVIEDAYRNYGTEKGPLYTKELLQEILLGLRSMCVGAESRLFNGHTNITSDRFLVFGVRDLLNGNENVKDAMLFNILSYLSDRLLTEGNTAAVLDELYIWLSSRTTVEYIRNTLKRVRKRDSSLLMASQNLEDFNVEGVRELTRPLFAIPTHQFIFHCGSVDREFYLQNLQMEDSEYELVRHPQTGVCLYKCGSERFLLEVHAPAYKSVLFGSAGGR